MWTTLLLLFLITFDLGTARNPLHRNSIDEQGNSNESRIGNEGDSYITARLPRRFAHNDTRTRRLHIQNQTGFDGKVERIHVNSDEAGIQAYGLPRKNLEVNGLVERIPAKGQQYDENLRSSRVVEAYGMPKEHLENNGQIDRLIPVVIKEEESSENKGNRMTRSIDTEERNKLEETSNGELEDLEAQDAKVFRPLFVYRQQVARRQSRNRDRNQVHGPHLGSHKPCYHGHPAY